MSTFFGARVGRIAEMDGEKKQLDLKPIIQKNVNTKDVTTFPLRKNEMATEKKTIERMILLFNITNLVYFTLNQLVTNTYIDQFRPQIVSRSIWLTISFFYLFCD